MTYRRPDPAELPPWRGRRIVAWAILPPDASQEELERVVDHLTAEPPGRTVRDSTRRRRAR